MTDFRILLSAVLLAAGVSASVAAALVHVAGHGAPGIASVRLAELVAEHAERAALDAAGTKETAAATRAWARALEDALGRVAARHAAVLLPTRAVAAGAPDLTAEVRAELDRTLAGVDASAKAKR